MDRDYPLGPYRRGNVSSGKQSKLFVRLKLGLIGFVLSNVRCSLFVGISVCSCSTYVYITHFEIGFVLHN